MDITYCVNTECKLKAICGRYHENENGMKHLYWISYAHFEPEGNGSCAYFFSCEKFDDDNN